MRPEGSFILQNSPADSECALLLVTGDGQVRSGLCEGDDLPDRGCAAGELLC